MKSGKKLCSWLKAQVPAKRKSKTWRPEVVDGGSLGQAQAEVGITSEGGLVVKTWVDLPGDNAQRRARWAPWKDTVRDDFKAFAKLQDHPGIIHNPRVHILAIVGSASDPANQFGRYKFLVDMLQPASEGRNGRHGLLGLIQNDRALEKHHITVTEVVNRKVDDEGYTHRSVALYVYEGTDEA